MASPAASLEASASATEASPASTGDAASPFGIDEVQVATPFETRQVYPGEQPHDPQSPWWHTESRPHTAPLPQELGPEHRGPDGGGALPASDGGTQALALLHKNPSPQSEAVLHRQEMQASVYVWSGQSQHVVASQTR